MQQKLRQASVCAIQTSELRQTAMHMKSPKIFKLHSRDTTSAGFSLPGQWTCVTRLTSIKNKQSYRLLADWAELTHC